MSFNLDTSQLSDLENYQPPMMRKKQQILERSKKGHEKIVDRLQRKIICDKLANEEAKKQELQEKSRKLREWNQLMETVKSYQIPLISSISTNADDDTPFPLSPTKNKFSSLDDSILSFHEKESFHKERDDKKAELLKLASLEAKERCTIRKRYYERKAPFETFNKLLKFQNDRRNAYNEGRLKILTLDEEFDEYEERMSKIKDQEKEIPSSCETVAAVEEKTKPKLQVLEISSGSVGNLRGNITPKVSLVKKKTDFVVQYLDKEELVSTQEIRKLATIACRNVIEYQEDLHRKRVRVYISKEMDQIVQRVVFTWNTRQAIEKFVRNIVGGVVKSQNEIARRKRNAKLIADEVDRICKKVVHYNETKQEIERVVSLTIKNVIETQTEKQNREYISKEVKLVIGKVIHHHNTKQALEKTAKEICQNVIHTQTSRQYVEKFVKETLDNVVKTQNRLFIKNESEQILRRVIHTQETRQFIENRVSDILNNVISTQTTIKEEKEKREIIKCEVSSIIDKVIHAQTTKQNIEQVVASIFKNVIDTQTTKQEIAFVSVSIIENVIRNQNQILEHQRNQEIVSNIVENIFSNIVEQQNTKQTIEKLTLQIIENVIVSQNTRLEIEDFVSVILENVISQQVEKQNRMIISCEVEAIIQRILEFQSSKVSTPEESQQAQSEELESPIEPSEETEMIIQQYVENILKNVISLWEPNKLVELSDSKQAIQQEVEKIVKNVIEKWESKQEAIEQEMMIIQEIPADENIDSQTQDKLYIEKMVIETLEKVVDNQNRLYIKSEVDQMISRILSKWQEPHSEISQITSEEIISQEVEKIIQSIILRNQ